MGGLPHPDVPPGPRRDLDDALHGLHHRAGWPSLRVLAGDAGCSHTTVSSVFSSPRLPSWGVLELIVEAMGGDVVMFHELWLAASSPTSTGSAPAPGIAGRKGELDVVRRHLETGSGLLLVTGEAGIGKSRLVTSAVPLGADPVRVAVAPCLPLSSSVPLFPFVDALRGLQAADPGGVRAALASSPAYVASSLTRLLPELGRPEPAADDAWSHQRLFLAVSSLLGSMHRRGALALVIEDLHWADAATLDLLEHLLATASPVPVVGTWRTDDPHVSDVNADWCVRVRRMTSVTTLELAALNRDETREQLRLLAGREPTEEQLDLIHHRARGQPLFTEQLASQAAADPSLQSMPSLLADLLDARLGDVEGPSWLVARALGVAERPLDHTVLRAACGLGPDDLSSALRDLHRRRLLGSARGGREAELRHPLLADAIGRRLVGGEAAVMHARLADVLAAQPTPEPGEIARHWQGAGDQDRELAWRIAAARSAGERFAAREELDSWRRVLELWPRDTARVRTPPTSLCEVHVRAIDVAESLAEIDEVRRLVADAMRLGLDDEERVEVLRRAGDVECAVGDSALGLTLLAEALTIHERLPAAPGFVATLWCRAANLAGLGRFSEAWVDIRRALEVADELDDPWWRRRMLSKAAWCRAVEGRYDEARSLAREAWTVAVPRADPIGDIEVAVSETDILLQACAPAAVVAEAAAPGLRAADRWQLTTFHSAVLRFNVCEAYLRAGDVSTAAGLVDPVTHNGGITHEGGTFAQSPLQVSQAAVDVCRGRLPEALARFETVSEMPGPYTANRAEEAGHHADAELWAGLAERAATRVNEALEFLLPTEASLTTAWILCIAARAEADLLASGQVTPGDRTGAAHRLTTTVTQAAADPFGPDALVGAVPAYAATWAAELTRVSGTATVEHWTRVAAAWDKLARPHDAAYARWRAGQVALTIGQATLAARLLRRAARDAAGHVPLLDAITVTMSPIRQR